MLLYSYNQTLRYLCTDSKMNQWNKEESPKLNPGIYGYFIYYKGSTTKPRVFSINGDGQVDNK